MGRRLGVVALVVAGVLGGCGGAGDESAPDERVRAEVKDVHVVLRDAPMSLAEMQALSDRVIADLLYWSQQGVVIGSVGPAPDGSGITVMTVRGSANDRGRLVKRYGTDAIKVSAGTIYPAK